MAIVLRFILLNELVVAAMGLLEKKGKRIVNLELCGITGLW